VRSDFKTELNLSTILRRSFIEAYSKAISGASHTLHGYLDYLSLQLFTDTMDEENLLRDGTIYGVARNEATIAELNITITFTGAATVAAGTAYQHGSGQTYTIKNDVTAIGAGTEAGIIVADEAGAAATLAAAETVTLTSPIANVQSSAVVDSTAFEGEDQESIESYRSRVLARKQAPPQGGTNQDFKNYALSVPGITRAWVIPGRLGPGTVTVYVVEDDETPIFPDQAKLDEVFDAISELMPVEVDLFVVAPVEREMNPIIRLKPNTAAVQAAVQTELEDLIARSAQVRGTLENSTDIYDGIIRVSQVREAISIAQGEEDHVLVFPTEDFQPQEGGILTLGTITFLPLA